jgi:hypothetical protein
MRLSSTLRNSVKVATAKMATPKITLYVDTVSPFAYLAYYIFRVCISEQRWRRLETDKRTA